MTAAPSTKLVFVTNAKSMLQNLQSYKKVHQMDLSEAVLEIYKLFLKMVLQWIPDHCQIQGNKHANELGKDGASMEQTTIKINL